MVSVIGVGTGINMMTVKAVEYIKNAQVIIGASRIIESYKEYFKTSEENIYREYNIKNIKDIIKSNDSKNIAILVSGDTGFYSLADSICSALDDVEFVPGISSVNSFFAKIKMPWHDAALVSAHGRTNNIVDIVRRSKKTFVITGNNVTEIADSLKQADYSDLEVYVGSNLDSEDEVIEHTKVADLKNKKYDALTVLLIINENADASVRSGISDDEFIRGDVPMTKSEIRSSIISKLNIKPDDICFDIGAGTGSVTVEMALSAWNGKVFAIEKKQEGIDLINSNIRKFHIGNVQTICGEATEIFNTNELPVPNVAFIGGSDGHLKDILSLLYERNQKIKIVVSAIALETLQTAMNSFKELGKEIEITQISVSKNRGISGLNLMMANNPVYIIKGL